MTPPLTFDDAPCKGRLDVMFAETYRGDGTERARAICRTCGHVAECLAYAQDNYMVGGVWGGCGPITRARMRRERAA